MIKNRTLILLQDSLFLIISSLYINIKIGDSIGINSIINVAAAVLFIAVQFVPSLERIREDLNIASGLFILYNLIPAFILYSGSYRWLSVPAIAAVFPPLWKSLKETAEISSVTPGQRKVIGAIIGIFAFMFIARGVGVINDLRITGKMTENTAVGISDIIISSFWLYVSILFLLNRRTGGRYIYSIVIHAVLMFLALVIFMLLSAALWKKVPDWEGIAIVAVMSLFFIIPFVILTKKKSEPIG